MTEIADQSNKNCYLLSNFTSKSQLFMFVLYINITGNNDNVSSTVTVNIMLSLN